ncbi:MAG: amidase [Gemmatimonadota bacterium]
MAPDSGRRADASADEQGGRARSSSARPEATAAWEPEPFQRPEEDEDLAYLPVSRLASLLRSRQVSSTELTELYLARLKKYDSVLHAVITLTEERAREQAARADRELDAGRWRGPLHGIPWGAKDLLAARGYPTTWGAVPYRDQVIDEDSAVVGRLDDAGAVLVAKLTLGALAWGDVWFGGQTKNPWNIEQGSSGSSAGPAASVAAGLVGFAVGSETLGSIVSPATRNGVTGLRPTFGRVSRHGAMALSWSMDKLGPICRSAEDCALVFSALHGRDPRDPSTVDAPFDWPGVDVGDLRVGYVVQAFEGEYEGRKADQRSLEVLRGLGIELRPVSLPDMPVQPLLITLEAEAASAFDELTRNGGVDRMVRQVRRAWPNVFRQAHLIPAVEYIQANRARTLLMRALAEAMREVDVFVSPSFRGGALSVTNLTGHPSVTVPNDFRRLKGAPLSSPRRQPGSITFVGGLYREEAALALAQAYQRATDFHRRRPPIA